MCKLYSITTNQAAIMALFRVMNRYVGNLAPMPGVFPDYKAPIVRAGNDGRELATARWGMPSSSKALMDATKKRAEKLQAKGKPVDFNELLRMEPGGGTTNIRNVKSKHWTRWLGPENRCVVPLNSFSEFNKVIHTTSGDAGAAPRDTPADAGPRRFRASASGHRDGNPVVRRAGKSDQPGGRRRDPRRLRPQNPAAQSSRHEGTGAVRRRLHVPRSTNRE